MKTQTPLQILRQSAGFSLPMAVACLALVVVTLTIFYPMMSRYLSQSKQYLNTKAEISAAESAIKLILTSPLAYECNFIGGVPNCSFLAASTSKLADVKAPAVADIILATLQRIGCEQGKNCQVQVNNGGTIMVDTMSTRVSFTYSVRMTGMSEFVTSIDVKLPMTTLLNKFTPCPGALVGIGPDGSSICKDITSPRAGIGQYISAIDPITYQVTFSSVPGEVRDCADADKFILTYSWTGNQKYKIACGDRLSPTGAGATATTAQAPDPASGTKAMSFGQGITREGTAR